MLHKWAMLFEGGDVFLASALGFALTAPGYSARDISDWFDGQNVSGEHLEPYFDELSRKLLGGELTVPVFAHPIYQLPGIVARDLRSDERVW